MVSSIDRRFIDMPPRLVAGDDLSIVDTVACTDASAHCRSAAARKTQLSVMALFVEAAMSKASGVAM
jgi:hypothetical protein